MRPFEAQFELAKAWAAAGEWERAEAGFRRVLAQEPEYLAARAQLGHTLLKLGRVSEALECYAAVLEVAPDELEARTRYTFVQEELQGASKNRAPRVPWASHADGKLDLRCATAPIGHRSGWAAVLQALEPLHNDAGVLFDGGIEENFARRHWHDGVRDRAVLAALKQQGLYRHLATSEEQGLVPYKRPWVGVVHNPPNMPAWFHAHESPQRILGKKIWAESARHCRGLFTFSEYAATWLRAASGLSVAALKHPTELDVPQFDFERFLANPNKQVVQLGWWLRQVSAIHRLPLARGNPLGYAKVWLLPHFFGEAEAYQERLLAREVARAGERIEPRYAENTRRQSHLSNARYDALLTENIALVMLYDANANNAVVECIARATPLLINRLPAVEEYLGRDYPLYVEDLDEAAAKALDPDLLARGHVYLKALAARRELSFEHFVTTLKQSAVYQALELF